jgi:toxin HigB-1
VINRVELSKLAKKQLKKLPRYIQENLDAWIEDVENVGLYETRKKSGYHDEPLQGYRWGQRAIRLNKAYRAIYIILKNNKIEFILIEEVSKHDY